MQEGKNGGTRKIKGLRDKETRRRGQQDKGTKKMRRREQGQESKVGHDEAMGERGVEGTIKHGIKQQDEMLPDRPPTKDPPCKYPIQPPASSCIDVIQLVPAIP